MRRYALPQPSRPRCYLCARTGTSMATAVSSQSGNLGQLTQSDQTLCGSVSRATRLKPMQLQEATSYFSITEVLMKSDRPRKPLAFAFDSRTAFSSGVSRTLT